MKNLIPGWIWIPAAFVILVGTAEYFIDSGDNFAFVEYPILQLALLIALVFFIALDVILSAIQNVMFQSLSPEAKEKYLAAREERLRKYDWKVMLRKMNNAKLVSEERDIELDHNYDGIKELDNTLPPWWLYSFYASIIFAGVYMAWYHVFDGVNQEEEYLIEMAEARVQILEYKRTAPDLIDANTVELLTGQEDVDAGKSLYITNCAACHKVDAGGSIGPNLTDDYWILGGGIKNIFNTISEGGRSGKGMIAWKSNLKPREMAQVASYIMSLHGATPQDPKEPEGELWIDEDALIDEVNVKEIDSTKMEIIIEDDPIEMDLQSNNE